MPPVGFEPKISAGERPVAARLLRGKGEKTLFLNLFLCDVSVAVGGHVDFNPTHYYLPFRTEGIGGGERG